MKYKFNAYGHKNILATHKTTLEFTKDKDVTINGDCVIGVCADFELGKLKEFIKKSGNSDVTITIKTISDSINIEETVKAKLNCDFNDPKEIVIRKTDFISERTFAVNSNKAAFDLKTDLISFLRQKKSKISVIIENRD